MSQKRQIRLCAQKPDCNLHRRKYLLSDVLRNNNCKICNNWIFISLPLHRQKSASFLTSLSLILGGMERRYRMFINVFIKKLCFTMDFLSYFVKIKSEILKCYTIMTFLCRHTV